MTKDTDLYYINQDFNLSEEQNVDLNFPNNTNI